MTSPPEVTAITLGVRDVETSRTFYVDGLGFRSILDIPGDISFVQCAPGQLLALWNVEQMPSEYGDVGHGHQGPPMSLGHTVDSPDEVKGLYAAALAAGATTVSEPAEREWGGWSACVADPDGFRWDFVHNPNLRVDADGIVHMGSA